MKADSEGLTGNMFTMDVLTSAGQETNMLSSYLYRLSKKKFHRNICERTCTW